MIGLSRFRKARVVIAIFGLTVWVAGCADQTLSDLEQFVATESARKAPEPAPLPPIKPYNVYTYEAAERDPFKPFFEEDPDGPTEPPPGTGVSPDFNRNKEELESFPLDSLRMVGTLEQGEDVWAVVFATDSSIHRVQIGNYMGQNHGKIVNIQEDKVDLIEIARDARGNWQERPASIALVEQE